MGTDEGASKRERAFDFQVGSLFVVKVVVAISGKNLSTHLLNLSGTRVWFVERPA
jgi:hypothetical protein